MKDQEDNRRPEEIESEIERTRAQLSSTLDAIQSKLTPGQMMDQAISYARSSLPAEFGSNLNHAIRQNPVPVALIGVGIAWLMMSGQNAKDRVQAGRVASGYRGEYGTEYPPRAGVGAIHDGAIHQTGSHAHETQDKLQGKVGAAGHRISDTAASMADRTRDMAHEARMRAGDLGHRSQQQYHRARDQFSRMADEQPLMVGVLGMALGTLMGALLPATQREDAVMGSARDDLLEKAKETAREQAPAVKESAQRVAQAAQGELERAASQMPGSQAQGDGHADHSAAAGESAMRDRGQSLH